MPTTHIKIDILTDKHKFKYDKLSFPPHIKYVFTATVKSTYLFSQLIVRRRRGQFQGCCFYPCFPFYRSLLLKSHLLLRAMMY